MPMITKVQLEEYEEAMKKAAMLQEKLDTPGVKELPKQDAGVPSDFRGIVDQTLNKKFGIKVVAAPDTPTFLMTIEVPDIYSALSAEQKKMLGGDIRPKVISNAEGSNGVKIWAEKVFSSFQPDMQAKITSDRLAVM